MSGWGVIISGRAKKGIKKLQRSPKIHTKWKEVTKILSTAPLDDTPGHYFKRTEGWFKKSSPPVFSRRLDFLHRVFYHVHPSTKTVEVLQAWGHDKPSNL